jgi:CheY-like chemotaxis protein
MTVLELAERWAEPPRILLVESDRGSVKVVIDLLSHYECDLRLVTTLSDALDAVMLNAYDLAFVEMSLTDGSGLDVVKAIKAQTPSTPVLVLTEASERQSIESIADCGPVTVVRKLHDLSVQNILTMFKVRAAPRTGAAA